MRHDVTINNNLLDQYLTDRLRSHWVATARNAGKTVAAVAKKRRRSFRWDEFGDPAQFGDLYACLYSTRAALIKGQNPLFDGGADPRAR